MANPPGRTPHRWFGLAYLLVFGAGIGFFLLSYIALAVLPGMRLADSIKAHAPAGMPHYSAAELRGRQLYGELGCALCHTQQVRYLPADVRRWGAPTEAWETRYDYPQLWGTRRIGPDLARETQVRSDDWQRAHLYDPQSVVPDSAMPGFPWLFDGAATRPTPAASDLLAYLGSLGRAHTAVEKRPAGLPDNGMDPAMLMQIVNLCATPFVNPNQARIDPASPDLAPLLAQRSRQRDRGRTLFTENCAGCHGVTGPATAAPALLPHPTDLRVHHYSTRALAHALWNGVPGSSMPAWRELPLADIASLAVYVQDLHPPVTAAPQPAALLAHGAVVYARHCLDCHGVEGDGKGPAAITFLPRPADFTAVRADTTRVLQVLANGIPGTAMPSWPRLSRADRQAVAAFVATYYAPSGKAP